MKCLRCGHEWNTRVERRPVQCPRCKSTSWERERTPRLGEPRVAYEAKSGTVKPGEELVQMGDGRWVTWEEAHAIQKNTDWHELLKDSPGWGDPTKTPEEILAEMRRGWRDAWADDDEQFGKSRG
jgi:DNA-directed RNA polymerase subunit RPC12/RpoP